MRIAVLGAGGQLAHDLIERLAGHEVIALARSDADLRHPEAIENGLDAIAIDVVVNTAAYNLVDKAESEPLVAFETNAVGVGNLARYCGRRGLRLIHFSTDYVFGLDDTRDHPWETDDAPGPISAYGNSKLAGEFAVRAYAPNHLVVRTCGLYGRKGSRGKGGNFVETMLKLADSGKPLRIVNDQRCTPSYVVDVADTTARLLETDAVGVVHATNSGGCTWFEFASEIFRLSGKTVDCQPVTSKEYVTAARRPAYSVLSLERLKTLGLPKPPAWQDALGRYLQSRNIPPCK